MSATHKTTAMSLAFLAVATTTVLALPEADSTIDEHVHQRYGPYGGYPYGGGSGYGSGSGSSGSSSGFPGIFGTSLENAIHYRSIHGIVTSVAMVVLFPIGSILMRIIPGRLTIWLHAFTQVLAFLLFVAGVALGIYLVKTVQIPFGDGNLLSNSTVNFHPIIGIVCLATLFFQPILGFVHHARFKQLGRRTIWSHLHLWNGRIAVSLGIVNGGLGLKLANAPRNTKIAYTVVAAIIWFLWFVIAVFSEFSRARNSRSHKNANNAAIAAAAAVPGARDGTNGGHRLSRNSGPSMSTTSSVPVVRSPRSHRSPRSTRMERAGRADRQPKVSESHSRGSVSPLSGD